MPVSTAAFFCTHLEVGAKFNEKSIDINTNKLKYDMMNTNGI